MTVPATSEAFDVASLPVREPEETATERRAAAAAYGVPEDAVIVLPVRTAPPLVIPPPMDQFGGRKLPPTLNVAYAGDPVFWLDGHTRLRRSGEDDLVFGYRLWVELADRGLLNMETGRRRSPLAVVGLDITDPEIVERLTAFRDGERDEDLEAIVVPPANLTDDEADELAASLAKVSRAAQHALHDSYQINVALAVQMVIDDIDNAPTMLAEKLVVLRAVIERHRQWVGSLWPAGVAETRAAMGEAFEVVQQALVDLWDLQWLPRSLAAPELRHPEARANHDVGLGNRINAVIDRAGALYEPVESRGGQPEDVEALSGYLASVVNEIIDERQRIAPAALAAVGSQRR